MDIHIYHHFADTEKEITKKLNRILATLMRMEQKEVHMSQELDDLKAAVAENAALDDSIIQLVEGLAAQIVALKDDPVALAALATEVRAKSALIAAAIQANTPQA
jgi:predicted PP-loop superfamily ATPase